MCYKKIILGRIHCEKAPQVVRACPSEGHHSCGHHGHQTGGQHGWDREEPEDIFLILGADIEMGHFFYVLSIFGDISLSFGVGHLIGAILLSFGGRHLIGAILFIFGAN